MKGLRELLLLLIYGFQESSGFNGPTSLPRLSTSLHMGLGSFVKKRFGSGGSEDNNAPATPITPTPQSAPPPKNPAPPLVNLSPPPAPRRSDPSETTQDRINRVKQGKMTEEEKQKFLQTTLKSSLKAGGPVANNGSSPLRQSLPDERRPSLTRNSPSATPFPKDSMLREVVSGRKDSGKSSVSLKPDDGDKKKKAYLDMVTNPNRFSTFNVQGNPVPEEATPEAPIIGYPPEPPEPVVENGPGETDNDLASRLEAGAYAEEQRQRELRRQVEQQREQERLRQMDLLRQREDELAEREAEALRRKRDAMDRAQAEEERKRMEESERQRKMMQAQEDYWKEKLELERQRKLAKLTQEQQAAEAQRAAEAAKLVEKERIKEQSRLDQLAFDEEEYGYQVSLWVK